MPPALGGVGSKRQYYQVRSKVGPTEPNLSQAKIGPRRGIFRNVLLTPPPPGLAFLEVSSPHSLVSFDVVARWCSSRVVYSGGFVCFGHAPLNFLLERLLSWGMLGPDENPAIGESYANPPSRPTRGGPPPLRPESGGDWAGRWLIRGILWPRPAGVGLFRGPHLPSVGLPQRFRLGPIRGFL